jgi:hypothetical protein
VAGRLRPGLAAHPPLRLKSRPRVRDRAREFRVLVRASTTRAREQCRTVHEFSISSQLNVTVCPWPSLFDDALDTVWPVPIIPTSAALSSKLWG